MRVLYLALLIAVLTGSLFAQSNKKLEKLVSDLKVDADTLVEKTNKEIRKDGVHSTFEIKSAFLAEQLRASTTLVKRLIEGRYQLSEIRYAGMILEDLVERFPAEGRLAFEWKQAKDSIRDLSRELRGINTGSVFKNAEYETDSENILGRAVWTGTVDADVVLSVRGNKIVSKAVAGRKLKSGSYSFSSKLPRLDRLRVGARIKYGRGKVHVMQQPTYENDYTATIQIRDEEGGARAYAVEIYWYKR